MGAEASLDGVHAGQVPQVVLRHGLGVAAHAGKERRGLDAEQLAQLRLRHARQRLVVAREDGLVQRAAHEHPQQGEALRRAARVLHARKGARDDGPPLDLRYDEAEAVERVRDVRAAPADRHRRRGRVRDPIEQVRQRRIRVAEHAARLVGLGGDDDGVRRGGDSIRQTEAPAGAVARDARDARLEPDGFRGQPRRERAGELLHPVGEGDEQGPARAARPGRLSRSTTRPAPEPEDEAPLPALELEEARHGGGQREHVGIGRIDPRDQRLGHALQGLDAQPPGHEGPQALVGIAASRQDEIHRHPELAGPGEESRAKKGPEPRRRQACWT